MTENTRLLSPLEEARETNEKIKKIIKRGNSIIKKGFMRKNSLRNSLDISSLVKKRAFLKKNSTSSPVDLCLKALDSNPRQRDNESMNYIISYLKSLPNFMNILSKEKNTKLAENLIEQISLHLRHEFIPKNNIVCRFGEKGEKFYIILKGKVIFLIPKPSKCYLNLEEYVLYLIQLRKNNEFELINNLLVQNRIYYHIEDDNLDFYLMKEYDEYQRFLNRNVRIYNKSKTKIIPTNRFSNRLVAMNNDIEREHMPTIRSINMNISNNHKEKGKNKDKNQKKYFSQNTYKKIEEVIEIIKNPKLFFNEDPFLGIYNPKFYMKTNNVINTKLESKGRKLVNIYTYEEMSTFENGQTFGFIALQSKNSKRVATAIVVEDSDLGVLTKEEYIQFFEILSNKEKKNLYELLKFYNLITTVSEYKFIKRYYHMFEYVKFRKNKVIMEINKKVNDIIVFNSGLFMINICVNIPELNELITKLKLIRGKLLGLSKYKIERQLVEKRENQDIIMRKNYMSAEENKILLKKYNYTLSIVSDHLIIGYPDTVDPLTGFPLFNCSCISAESDGYLISNRSISLINEESVVIHNLKDFCLMKLDYNLKRLQQFKKEILSKSKKNEISPPRKTAKSMEKLSLNGNKERCFSESNINNNDILLNNNLDEDNIYAERNQIIKKKGRNNNKMLLSFKFHSNLIETLNNYKYNIKIEETKNQKEKKLGSHGNYLTLKILNKINDNSETSPSKADVINKLRDSILQKKKNIELKKEHYFKIIEDINQKKKEKMKKKIENAASSLDANSMKDFESPYNNIITENDKKNNYPLSNRIQNTISKDCFSPPSKFSKREKNNTISKSYKTIKAFQNDNKEKLLNLPQIEKSKNERNRVGYVQMRNLLTESSSKINYLEINKNQNSKKYNKFTSYDDLNQISLSPSLIKEKYIIFKSPYSQKENYITYDYDKQQKAKSLKPARLKKDNKQNMEKLDDNNQNDEEKKFDYINIISYNNQIKKRNLIDYNIKEKYKELNNFVISLQKTTNEMLDKKGEVF